MSTLPVSVPVAVPQLSSSFNLSDFSDDKYNDSLDSNVAGNIGEPNATLLKSKLNELEEKLNLYKLHHEIIYDADVNPEINGATPYSIKNSNSKHNQNSVITKEGSNISMSRASLDTNFNQMWYFDENKYEGEPRKINARYIRVQNRGLPQLTGPWGGNWLQIQELEVWGYEKGDSGNLGNLAYKGREGGAGSIEVKSEWHQAKRHNAVNGNISNFNGVYHSTEVGEDEFWQLDLGDSYTIKKIVYYNRHDCCQNRAANMTINVYNTKPNNSDLNKVGGLIPQIILTSDIKPQEFDLDQYISDFENAGKIKSYNGKSCLSGETDDSITMKTCDDNDIKQRWNTSYTSLNEKREYIIYSGVTNDKCITNDTNAIKLTNDCGSGINTSKWLIYPSDLPLLKEKINDLAREANELIKIIIPKGDGYKAAMDMNVTRLLTKNTELQQQHAKLLEKLKEPMKLDENFELSKLTTTSNFSYYMLYLIFTIFIVGCLIFVFKNPEESNLDMFILALAGMIFAYYVYDYYKKRKRN